MVATVLPIQLKDLELWGKEFKGKDKRKQSRKKNRLQLKGEVWVEKTKTTAASQDEQFKENKNARAVFS